MGIDRSKILTKEQKCAAKKLFDEGKKTDPNYCTWSEEGEKYIEDAINNFTTGGSLLNALYYHNKAGCQSYDILKPQREAFKALFQETDACTFCCGESYCNPTLEGKSYFNEILGDCSVLNS